MDIELIKKVNDMNDITIRTINDNRELPHSDLTGNILSCCFEVMKELGPGFFGKSI